MKWFHHECTAKNDTKLRALGEEFGLEGIGAYWMILEEIGTQSDTFHLKVTGLSAEADRVFAESVETGEGFADRCGTIPVEDVPRTSLKALARVLFTTEEPLRRIIEKSVEEGLFDKTRWRTHGMLYSASFEQRADTYTKRRRRTDGSGCTVSEHCSTNVHQDFEHSSHPARTVAEGTRSRVVHISESSPQRAGMSPNKVPPEQRTEQTERENAEGEEEENEEAILFCNVASPFESPEGHAEVSMQDAEVTILPSTEQFEAARLRVKKILTDWNEYERSDLEWAPTLEELRKFFYGGDPRHKLWLCRQALNLNGGRLDYPRLVLRAISLMLEASKKQRIENPFGWIWSCLHGTPEGLPPWVHMPTATEEARRTGSARPPP